MSEKIISQKKKNNRYYLFMFVQMVVSLCGTVLGVMMLVRTLSSSFTASNLIIDIVYLAGFVILVLYGITNYKKDGDIYFQIVIFGFAAILGVQILQNGMFISNYGLSASSAMLINIANLIAFGNAVKFADHLGKKKIALSYICIAVAVKLLGELYLIILMRQNIQLIHILLSLSVPFMGIVIILTYLNRYKILKAH